MAETLTFETLPVARLLAGSSVIASGVPEGLEAAVLVALARLIAGGKERRPILHIARDGQRLAILEDALQFFAPDVERLRFPAWDGVPYDRVAPNAEIIARRVATLAELANHRGSNNETPLIVLTTVNAVLQRVPSQDFFASAMRRLASGNAVSMAELIERMEHVGYGRAGTVTDPGQYSVRGGILDFYPPGARPVRLDFFGDTLESIRAFDPETQRTHSRLDEIRLLPMSEAPLTEEARKRFRARYVELFGPVTGDDPLYESISAGRQHQGMEHWLPLFYVSLDTFFDFVPRALFLLGHQSEETKAARIELVQDYYETREQFRLQRHDAEKNVIKAAPYKPLKPEQLYLGDKEWTAALAKHNVRDLSPFQAPESMKSVDAGGKVGRDFQPERAAGKINVFQSAADHIQALQDAAKRVLIASWSAGSSERMGGVLSDHGLSAIRSVSNWPDAAKLHETAVGIAVLGLEKGFEAPGFAIVSEQDILGDRMVRAQTRSRRAQNVSIGPSPRLPSAPAGRA